MNCVTDSNSAEQRSQTADLVAQTREDLSWTDSPDIDQNGTSIRSSGLGTESGLIDPHLACADAVECSAWPRYFSKLRESFALDPHASLHEQHMRVQSTTQTPVLQAFELRRLREAIDGFPPQDVAHFLILACIDYAGDSFFYFNRAKMLCDMDDFYENSTSKHRSDPSFLCLAHATFALGSHWIQRARPRGSEEAISSAVPDRGNPGQLFYDHARSLVPDVIDTPNLRSVQAIFILGTYLLPVNANSSSHIYLGLALRKATALDLHKEADLYGTDEDDRETRRRIWWSIYALERCSTVKLNRPRSISAETITTALPKPHQSLDHAQKFDNVEYQRANAQLMLILDQVAICADRIPSKVKFDEFDARLKDWKKSLPWYLSITNIDPDSLSYRARFHLCLNYYFTYITMGKASMVTSVRVCVRHETGQDVRSSSVKGHVETLQNSCIEAASRMLHMFEVLHQSDSLEQFSFTDFQGCSIATVILLLASIIHHRSTSYERIVSFGLDCLRGMAQDNKAARLGVSFVEGLQKIAIEARSKRRQSEAAHSSATHYDELHRLRYYKWLDWVSNKQHDDSTPERLLAEGPTHSVPDRASWLPLDDPPMSGLSNTQQQYDFSETTPSEVPQSQGNRGNDSYTMDLGTSSASHEDEHAFLIGLTGMGIFGFPEPNG
ncbi:hypothetical protein K431DRAFT_238279 [Polychaeton citri CBS 116435]|uniref:Xylanolytic transcriptional activator regulatory domain-containing protein n=1 Tax=Polychaeton citri CBS 116435 TaxID=1314669 RepID=A0A9P4QJA7_9PEZI|nr:hypothetical protein K431DRAFT_238279 [Polychaeton citri CBS 116435]